jgi:hypothetical protein
MHAHPHQHADSLKKIHLGLKRTPASRRASEPGAQARDGVELPLGNRVLGIRTAGRDGKPAARRGSLPLSSTVLRDTEAAIAAASEALPAAPLRGVKLLAESDHDAGDGIAGGRVAGSRHRPASARRGGRIAEAAGARCLGSREHETGSGRHSVPPVSPHHCPLRSTLLRKPMASA